MVVNIRQEDILKYKFYKAVRTSKYKLGTYYKEKKYLFGYTVNMDDREVLNKMRGKPSAVHAIILLYKADYAHEELWSVDVVFPSSTKESEDVKLEDLETKYKEYFGSSIEAVIRGLDILFNHCMKLLYNK